MSTQDPLAGTSRGMIAAALARLPKLFDGYARILLVGSGVRIFGLVSQFVVLIMMGRMLAKSGFGDLMTAFGFYRLVAIAIGIAASLVVLYHVSRRPQDKDFEVRLHRYSALVAGSASAAVALIAAFGAGAIASVLDKPGLAAWFRELAPFAVFNCLLIVSTGALEGRSRITESIFIGELAPNVVRIVLLPVVWLAGLPDSYIAHVLTISVLIPWLFALPRLLSRPVASVRRWEKWDYSYAGKFVVATLFANQLAAVDILVAGVLFSSEAVGDYAIAARIATLFTFFEIAMLKRFAPRAGALIEAGDMASLRAETATCRRIVIAAACLTICGVLIAAPFIFPLFGNFSGAIVFLTWLAIPAFVSGFYATSDRLLIIAGQANVSLVLNASGFAMLVTVPFLIAPWLGMIALPAAMIASAILFNPIVSVRARQLFDVATITPLDIGMMVFGSAALVVSALTRTPLAVACACAVLVIVALTMIWSAMRQPKAAAAG